MIFPLLFQITVSTRETAQNSVTITRVGLTSRQLEERQMNFVRPREILVTIPLNQVDDRGGQMCLTTSIPRLRVDEIFSSTPETQRAGAIYSWLINLQTSVLTAYNNQSNSPSRFNFDLSVVSTTAPVVQNPPAVQIPVAPVLTATPTRTETPPATVLPTVSPVRPVVPPIEQPREQTRLSVVSPPTSPSVVAPPQPVVVTQVRPVPTQAPVQMSPAEQEQRFRDIIAMYTNYLHSAIQTHPTERQTIEQNYRRMFYGPSEDRDHGSICLVDQIQWNRILSADQKRNIISSLEQLLSRTPPVPTQAPTPPPQQSAPAPVAVAERMPAQQFDRHERQNLQRQVRERAGNNERLLSRPLADRLTTLLIELSDFPGFRNRFSSEGDIINEVQAGYSDFVHTLPTLLNNLTIPVRQLSGYQQRVADLVREIDRFVGPTTHEETPPTPAPTVASPTSYPTTMSAAAEARIRTRYSRELGDRLDRFVQFVQSIYGLPNGVIAGYFEPQFSPDRAGTSIPTLTTVFDYLRQAVSSERYVPNSTERTRLSGVLNTLRQPPSVAVQTPSSSELTDAELVQTTRASLNLAEQQIYDNIIRGDVTSILRVNLPVPRLEAILRAVINDRTLNIAFGMADEHVVAIQREILTDATIAADLPDLWARSNLSVLTANGVANVQTLAALALFRWRALHPEGGRNSEVGRWDPNWHAPAPVVRAPPVTQPTQQPVVQSATVSSSGPLTSQQNDLLLDVIVGTNLVGNRPRFARLFESMNLLTSNPTFFAEQLYYFYTNQVANNDQYRIARIGQMSPTTDVLHRTHNYLLATNSTPEQANNLVGYRTVLLNALLEAVRSECAPYEIRDGAPNRRRFGDPISNINAELSALLRRAGFDPSFLTAGATAQQIQNAPLDAVVLAISYIEWRVHNRNVGVPDFNALIVPSGTTVIPSPPPLRVAPVQNQPPGQGVASAQTDSQLVSELTENVTEIHGYLTTVQNARAQIAAQLARARVAVANRNQTELDQARAEINRLSGSVANYQGTGSLVETPSRDITRLLPFNDPRRSRSPYQQLVNQASTDERNIGTLIGQIQSDVSAANALAIREDPSVRRTALQTAYNTARDNLQSAIDAFNPDVAYCREQLIVARAASRSNNSAAFTDATTNFNGRLSLLQGAENISDIQVTLADLTALMTRLRDANTALNEVDPSGRGRRVSELNAFTRTINGGSGSFEATLNGYESEIRRLRVPTAPTVPAPRPLSATAQALLRDAAMQGDSAGQTRFGPLRTSGQTGQATGQSQTPTYPTIETGAIFGDARLATNVDGSIRGNGTRENPYVIDIPLRWPGHNEVVNILTEQTLYDRRCSIRFQFRTVDSTAQVTQNAFSQSITTAFNTLVRNIRPIGVVSPPVVREATVRTVSLRPLISANPDIEAQFARR